MGNAPPERPVPAAGDEGESAGGGQRYHVGHLRRRAGQHHHIGGVGGKRGVVLVEQLVFGLHQHTVRANDGA
ncbi:MAG: hypothetical protein R2856_17915 [Caldilineaceae bacterium]